MKNKILNIALIGAALMATTSCSDYLETSSVSKTDGDFVFSNMVTARAAMNGAYTEWHGAISSHIFGDGLFYAFDIAVLTSCVTQKHILSSFHATSQSLSISTAL